MHLKTTAFLLYHNALCFQIHVGLVIFRCGRSGLWYATVKGRDKFLVIGPLPKFENPLSKTGR